VFVVVLDELVVLVVELAPPNPPISCENMLFMLARPGADVLEDGWFVVFVWVCAEPPHGFGNG